jgi:integrase
MLAGSQWHDEDLVFAQPNGRPIDKKTDYDDWTRPLQKAGVRHVRLHDGRHTAATLLLSENVHPRVVMELLGHSQMRTTMDIYSHVMAHSLVRRRTAWERFCCHVGQANCNHNCNHGDCRLRARRRKPRSDGWS